MRLRAETVPARIWAAAVAKVLDEAGIWFAITSVIAAEAPL